MVPKDLLEELFPRFKDIDPDDDTYRIGVPALVCLLSLGIFVATYLLSLPLQAFQRLSSSQKVFWSATVVRGLFGLWSIVFALWYLLFDDNLHLDIVTEYDTTSHFLCYVNLGFFLFEWSCLVLSNLWFRQFDTALMMHHSAALAMFFFIVWYDAAHFVGVISPLLEMTTPFSCVCWLLLKLKKQSTYVWIINQAVLVHLFHCRSIFELFWWWQTYKQWDTIVRNLPPLLAAIIYIGLIASTFFLTPFWTMRKTEQFFKRQDWNYSEPTTPVKEAENSSRVCNSVNGHTVANGGDNRGLSHRKSNRA